MAQYQVALITGGASGIGLAVAKALADRGGWHLHLLDLNSERGEQAAQEVQNATFHKTNVTEYDNLAAVFQKVFDIEERLDFVFANAGIVERFSFFQKHDVIGKPPPPPDLTVVDINLISVINTSWLAQHYFRQSKDSDNKNLIMTASCGGFYPVPALPSYAAAKAGVIHLMRSIAGHFYADDGIRVNAICPGTVRTNLVESWDKSGKDNNNRFVPIEKIVSSVLMLIDGKDEGGKRLDDDGKVANGVSGSSKGKLNGEAVELSASSNHYYRDQVGFCDASMAKAMGVTDKSNF